jgi:hypothetical protein
VLFFLADKVIFLDPAPRERAFHSGILDFALTRGLLPDEVILWILQSGTYNILFPPVTY